MPTNLASHYLHLYLWTPSPSIGRLHQHNVNASRHGRVNSEELLLRVHSNRCPQQWCFSTPRKIAIGEICSAALSKT